MWSDSDDEVVPILFTLSEAIEENDAKIRGWWVHPHNLKRDSENVIINFIAELRTSPENFNNYTRMRIETFDYLLGLIENAIRKQDTNYRKSITAVERLIITLRFLATGETFKSLSYQFRCGATTIERIVMETCQAVGDALFPIYLPQPDFKKWLSIADAFDKMWNFPNCLGAIDGKNIMMQCPPNSGPAYYNYKKIHSIHLQAVVDAHGQFIFADVSDSAINCDSGVFKHSEFGKQLMSNKLNLPQNPKLCPASDEYCNFVFVADESYALIANVMTPFAQKELTDETRIYNYRLSRARRVVECAFGMLNKKFRVFDTVIVLPPNKVKIITLAACALHNMIREREGLLHEIYAEREAMEYVPQEKTHENIGKAKPSNAARNIRNQYVQYFNSSTGAVPWQYKYAV